jgi:serine/threonine protein kinase
VVQIAKEVGSEALLHPPHSTSCHLDPDRHRPPCNGFFILYLVSCILYLEVCEAMVYLLSNNILHGDIKPQNILMDQVPDNRAVREPLESR